MSSRRILTVFFVLLLVSLSCSFFQSINPADRPADVVPSSDGAALLNEALFLPAQGEAAFIELKSSGERVSLSGLSLVNERGETYPLPGEITGLASDQFLLVVFDGTDRVEGNTVHSGLSGFLNPDSGSVELRASDGTVLDRVAWGPRQPDSVRLDRGGIMSDLEPGTTIGRFPLSVRTDPLEWTVFSPPQATPGAANPQPGVEVMIPLNGAVIGQTSFDLSWYPAPGAVEYRVQVAGDESFNDFVVNETTGAPELPVTLQPGTYFWRVQAVPEEGEPAGFSPAQKITVNPGFSSAHLAAPRRQTQLAVPFISQHKDTQMLLLESRNETGPHAWDVDHVELDRSDPADNTNCALASIAMINAFLGGDLSQDRIGYEVFKDFWDGPEYDLNYGAGLYDFQMTEALTFALEAAPEYLLPPDAPDDLWADIQSEIDAGNPILATKPGHAFVITGYYEDESTRYVFINDPWWGTYAIDITQRDLKSYWKISPDSIPVTDPDINQDSDGDGIVDFDETERFGTNPNDRDTDKDDVEDKQDVRASIFDELWGFAYTRHLRGRDFDNDGIKMELDEDSDAGGCFDGIEDYNFNGIFTEPETYNFEKGDDACFWGTNELLLDSTRTYDDGYHHQRLHTFVTFSLRAVEEGKLEGLAQIIYSHTGDFSSDLCTGTHDIGEGYFQATLEGEFQKLQDGSTLVSFRATPDHGEPYYIQWNTNCPAENELQEGWSWPGTSGTLKDGVYDLFTDYSSSLIGETGEFWQKIHLEQGQGME